MEKKFEPRTPDYKGFAVKKDGKAAFTKPHGAIWFSDIDSKPTKPFTLVTNSSPQKVRFFPYDQVMQAQKDYEEAQKIVKAKREQGTTTPIE